MDTVMINLLAKKARINEQIKKIKDTCKHPNHSLVNKADTGNYCPQDDEYWSVCECEDCGASWKQTQGINPEILTKYY